MPKSTSDKQIFTGTEEELDILDKVMGHYDMAKEDLDSRKSDFDKKDELFRSYLDEKKWPYQSLVFDPRIYTAIFEKTSRLLARKPKGRLVPREGGDTLGAYVSNELLNFQWDDNERVNNMPMVAKWGLMDQNARKYGAAFAVVKWHYETVVDRKNKERKVWYDGPDFIPWNNRDVLCDPSNSTIKNWVQIRDYVTIQDLKSVNDTAKSKPIYKNLDLLMKSLEERGGDRRDSNYTSKNLSVKNLSDYKGSDDVYKTIEIITEYRKDRWITFAPKHGIILRDIENPYDHGQIPVVMLKYYPVDDDIYGLSEIEPVEKLQKAINSLVCQYIDSVNMGLYPIVKVRSTGVEMHTLEWGPGKKWIMDDPGDVVAHEQGTAGIAEFTSTYRFLVGALQNALGETSAGISQAVPGMAEKTATEVKDLALQRTARDNYNQIFLSEALKKQMMLWHKMNEQFYFGPGEQQKVIRIVGKEAIKYFQGRGQDGYTLTAEAADLLANPEVQALGIRPEELQTLAMPVQTELGTLPKFTQEPGSEQGYLIIEPQDLSGTYDYIPDVESMSVPNESNMIQAQRELIQTVLNPAVDQKLMTGGYELDIRELLTSYFEKLGLKDAEKYFKKASPAPQMPGMGGMPGMEGVTNATNAGAGPAIKGSSLGSEYGGERGLASNYSPKA